MNAPFQTAEAFFANYASRMQALLCTVDWRPLAVLAADLERCWREGRQVFFCGNGGSAGNAMHLANDFLYGVAKKTGGGLRASALNANTAVLTCLANDLGYDAIYAEQLAVHATAGDVLIALSGSGNSPNIVRALETARTMSVRSFAVLGYGGGRSRDLADVAIHFAVDDMQIAEDLQLVVGHMLMQWLHQQRERFEHVR